MKIPAPGRRRSLTGLGLVCIAMLGASVLSSAQVKPAEPGAPGGILGHVEIPPDQGTVSARALLMSPEWALEWRGDVQQRLDAYSQTYRRAIADNPALFQEISRIAHYEATAYVLSQMERALREDFAEWVRPVAADGRFAFEDIPPGDYTVIVLAENGNQGMIWTETITVAGQIDELLEVQNRIQ